MRALADSDGLEGFTAYFTARRDVVRRTAYVLCGDWHRADDLAQAAFVRLAAGWHTVRDRQALDAFVRTCLVRAYIADTGRAWRRRELTAAAPPEPPPVDDGGDAVATRVAVVEALRSVPRRQRAVLVCRYYEGLDVAETAEVLRVSQGTVKSQTAKGLAALRVALGGVRDLVDTRPTWEAI
ncbi:SigE family RNA polymerase sigma factor [Longispora fulva]|uniref:RNA polymerase sigma-70 factor (Sigma-E family) n=1 Tax=Longispora fulva TaxID=619741 RepID=A0A8J7KQD9_9ACTN|nr:SigE family RNA polymerase sigma factor [Longispora fulva]MBG6137292.1 RNA polymerase sigma-70 factor (sigma-E family) [Longispora fulva]